MNTIRFGPNMIFSFHNRDGSTTIRYTLPGEPTALQVGKETVIDTMIHILQQTLNVESLLVDFEPLELAEMVKILLTQLENRPKKGDCPPT